MCRWFAYISADEPCLLEDVLVIPKHSIVKQVNEHYLPRLFPHTTIEGDIEAEKDSAARNLYFNEDGLGLAYYSFTQEEYGEAQGSRPITYKTIQPPVNDLNFRSICLNTSTLCVCAHVRMATSVVHSFNCHPFQFGRHVLQHNGSVAHFTLIRMSMCKFMSVKALDNINGNTDSEHIAALYMTYLGDDWDKVYPITEMKAALQKTVDTIIRLQTQLSPVPDGGLQPSSLNLCTTDGEQLLAVRFRNEKGAVHQPPSLYYSTTAGATLNRKYPGHPDSPSIISKGTRPTEQHGKHVIVVSEPTTYDENEWNLIPKNNAVLIGKDMEPKLQSLSVYAEFV